MEFFTKEWYHLCQDSGYHLLLKPRPRTAAYSEPYYRALYSGKLGAALKLEREVCALTGDPFRPEEFKAAFRREHLEQVERLRRALPREILEQAADLRVLALDAATPEIIAAVTRWCEDNRRRAEAVMEAYQTWADQVRPLVGPEIQDGFSFHDSQVTAVERSDGRLTLFLEPGGYSEVRQVDFLRPRILENDGDLEGACWLYGEVHPAEGGNEYHSLLWKEGRTLCLTVFAADLRLSPWPEPG